MKIQPHLKKTEDFHPSGPKWYNKINRSLAIAITKAVGTMWCAYIFMLISLSSLPSTIAEHSINADVQWVAQTFLQLVLLSIIIVGQNIGAEASDARSVQTYEDTELMKDLLNPETSGGVEIIIRKLDALHDHLELVSSKQSSEGYPILVSGSTNGSPVLKSYVTQASPEAGTDTPDAKADS